MKKIIALIGLSLLLAACGTDEDATSGAGDTVYPIEVEMLTPEEGDAGEWLLEVKVTQNAEPVEDASEVKFEVYEQSSKEESDMVDHTEMDEGVYSASYSFEEDGVYFVIPHVTARNMHSMPTHQIIVGDGHVAAEEEESHSHSHEHAAGLDYETNLEEAEGEFTVELHPTMDGEAITDARVRLEIDVPNSTDGHKVWLDAEELESGVYFTDFHFEEAGEYEIVFHIETDDLHEHPTETFEIE